MTTEIKKNETEIEETKALNFKELTMYLLSNYNFFYNLLQQCRITLDSKTKYLAWVKVSTKMEMTINPRRFAEYSIEEQAGIVIHELLHLYKDHIKQVNLKQVEALAEKIGSEPSHEQANIAMDNEINPSIYELKTSLKFGPNAPLDGPSRGMWPKDFNLPSDDSWFNYYVLLENNDKIKQMKKNQKELEKKIQDALDRLEKGEECPLDHDENGYPIPCGCKPGDKPAKDHDYFKESTKDGKMIDEVLANAAKRAKNLSHGNTPREIEKFLLDYEMSKQVPWNIVLRQFMQSLTDVKTKNTWKKANRRFRGKLPGVKRLPKLELLIGIDSSGSVSDEDLKKFYAEVDAINSVGNVQIDIVVFDTIIHQREEYKKGFEASRLCGGGTSFVGPHELAIEERYKGLILLTDGYADFPQANEVTYKCLWVINNDSVTPPYGSVVRIK